MFENANLIIQVEAQSSNFLRHATVARPANPPVLPNPPAPRTVSSRVSTTTTSGVYIWRRTDQQKYCNCGVRSSQKPSHRDRLRWSLNSFVNFKRHPGAIGGKGSTYSLKHQLRHSLALRDVEVDIAEVEEKDLEWSPIICIYDARANVDAVFGS